MSWPASKTEMNAWAAKMSQREPRLQGIIRYATGGGFFFQTPCLFSDKTDLFSRTVLSYSLRLSGWPGAAQLCRKQNFFWIQASKFSLASLFPPCQSLSVSWRCWREGWLKYSLRSDVTGSGPRARLLLGSDQLWWRVWGGVFFCVCVWHCAGLWKKMAGEVGWFM